MKKAETPCYNCPNRTENCHVTCREFKIFSIKKELEKRKIHEYGIKHGHLFTEGEKKRIYENLRWYGILQAKK